MKSLVRAVPILLGSALGAALFSTCGGGGTGESGEQATIDIAAGETAADELSFFVPICHTGAAALRSGTGNRPMTGTEALVRAFIKLRRENQLRSGGGGQMFLDPTKPPDEFGDCGGRITFPSYSHSNGTTTATLEFDNFCSVEAGQRNILDGTVNLVDHGTPGAFGPETTELDANSPAGIVADLKNSTGTTTLSSQRISFEDMVYDVGVPGGVPSSGHPDVVSWDELRVTDLVSGQSYRQDYEISQFITSNGTQSVSVTGRGYRSNGDFYDVVTTSPILTANGGDGNVLGGQITITGAGGSTAILNFRPGTTTLIATMTVNGTPVTGVPACP